MYQLVKTLTSKGKDKMNFAEFFRRFFFSEISNKKHESHGALVLLQHPSQNNCFQGLMHSDDYKSNYAEMKLPLVIRTLFRIGIK